MTPKSPITKSADPDPWDGATHSQLGPPSIVPLWNGVLPAGGSGFAVGCDGV